MSAEKSFTFLCNEASVDVEQRQACRELRYIRESLPRNVNIRLPSFVNQVYHLPDRVLDLLEIAGYVFAADRLSSRGARDSLEFGPWARSMHLKVRVRDFDFWGNPKVSLALCEALVFMAGDKEFSFEFQPGHSTHQTSLFDREEFRLEPSRPGSVVLFSGGLDSLCGAMEKLVAEEKDAYLISHQSGQPSTKKTQRGLVNALKDRFPDRVHHYAFECSLTGTRAAEESQRTRAFLFCSIAYALASALGLHEFYMYENGVTSLNLLRRQDLMNARASRTTHPKTLALMSTLLSLVRNDQVCIHNPFCLMTKSDVFTRLSELGGSTLISSSVSCSRTSANVGKNGATHCGSCFQCIDRRLAAFASGNENFDSCGIYAYDPIIQAIRSEDKAAVVDYVRQAREFSMDSSDSFYERHFSEMIDAFGKMGLSTDEDSAEAIFQLCHRHGIQVAGAIIAVRRQYDDPYSLLEKDSLLDLLVRKPYLESDSLLLARRISDILSIGIPIAFQSKKPVSERGLNDQVGALLSANALDLKREFPVGTFALSTSIVDHSVDEASLVIECKYVRGKTSPSKVSEGIAADCTKYPSEACILFVIYDPDRSIADDKSFTLDIERHRPCLVRVIR